MDKNKTIKFNTPYLTGKEKLFLDQALSNQKLAGDGAFTFACHQWIEQQTSCNKALLTHSCTAALEITALLLDIQPGDEVIMPSFTFVSTANAFVLRGAIPVFVDIRKDTLNINEQLISDAITPKTKAIVVVHYAGVACEMDFIMHIAKKHNLKVIEDAAQGVLATYKDKALGSIGDMGTFSFHETKNIISGEGGALLINDPAFTIRAEMIREKGTNRSQFMRGEVDKYTWQEVGSSYLPSEIIAAFLLAQFEEAKRITAARIMLWEYYHQLTEPLEMAGQLQRPFIPEGCKHNAHLYYIVLPSAVNRINVMTELRAKKIQSTFHYVPLHSSPAGRKHGRSEGNLDITNQISESVLRLPLWVGITSNQQEYIVEALGKAIKSS